MNTLASFMNSILGSYTPVTATSESVLADGTIVSYEHALSGLAGVDWSYVLSGLLFIIFVYCFLRMIGVLVKVCN